MRKREIKNRPRVIKNKPHLIEARDTARKGHQHPYRTTIIEISQDQQDYGKTFQKK